MSAKELVYVSYDDITMRIDGMMEEIKREQFSALVVLVRGGLFPAHYLSVRTGLPIFYLCPARPASTVSWIGDRPPIDNVLIVDDYTDTGSTLAHAESFLTEQGYTATPFVIFRQDMPQPVPGYCCFDSVQDWQTIVLPWRRMDFKSLAKTGSRPNSTEMSHREQTVWDFTCLHSYRTIHLASQSITTDDIPPLGESDGFLLTAPSDEDEDLLEWIQEMKLEPDLCRQDVGFEHMDAYSLALWKGQRLIEMGCTRYIENDAEQALVLSRYFPYMEVLWWNNGSPITVKASSFSF